MSKTYVRTRALLLVVLVPVLLLGARVSRADDYGHRRHGEALRLLKTVPIPGTDVNLTNGNLYSFDISFVDQSTQTYYLADRSNNVVDVVDAKTGTFDRQIAVEPLFPPFAGVAVVNGTVQGGQSGPNGVVAAFPWLFVTDASSRVVSIDLRTDHVVSDVSTGGTGNFRADELAYDPRDGLLLVINPNEPAPPNGVGPFGTLITVNKATGQLAVGTRISLFPFATNGAEQFATNGAEQPVWDPGTGKFYLSIPEINGTMTNQHGAVIRISTTGEVEAQYPIDLCGPAGLALGPRSELLVGCNTLFDTAGNAWSATGSVTAAPKDVILDVRTGHTTEVPGVGPGDEVWFNAGDGHYYATGSGSPLRPTLTTAAQGATALGVIDAEDQNLLQLVPTFNVPAMGTGNSSTEHPAGTSHSVTASIENNHVFVALAANNVFPDCLTGCIAVYGTSEEDTD
jgi:hypothetical protein